MGLIYVLFRIWFLLQKKTGLLVKRFPANPPFINAITLVEWKKSIFFIKSKEELTFPKNKDISMSGSDVEQVSIFFFLLSLCFY